MPQTTVRFYRDASGAVPVLEWLRELRGQNKAAASACLAKITLLGLLGHELRRPHSDFLRDGIYELRARVGRVNYRILYFFHGKDIGIVAHGLTKEQGVPDADIERALERKRRYEQSPARHSAEARIPRDAENLRRA